MAVTWSGAAAGRVKLSGDLGRCVAPGDQRRTRRLGTGGASKSGCGGGAFLGGVGNIKRRAIILAPIALAPSGLNKRSSAYRALVAAILWGAARRTRRASCQRFACCRWNALGIAALGSSDIRSHLHAPARLAWAARSSLLASAQLLYRAAAQRRVSLWRSICGCSARFQATSCFPTSARIFERARRCMTPLLAGGLTCRRTPRISWQRIAERL